MDAANGVRIDIAPTMMMLTGAILGSGNSEHQKILSEFQTELYWRWRDMYGH